MKTVPVTASLKKLAAAIAGLAFVLALPMTATFFGISRWLMYVCAFAAFLSMMALTQWRNLYPPNRPGLVLMIGGVFALAVCSIINERFVHFFTPGRIYFLAFLFPVIAWETYRYVKSVHKG